MGLLFSAPEVPVRAAAATDEAKKALAVVKYVQTKAAKNAEAKLVLIDQVIVDAFDLMPLTLPTTFDGPDRWLRGYVMSTYVAILRHREHLNPRENWGRIVLLDSFHQLWLEDIGDGAMEHTPKEMADEAMVYLEYDMVFFLMHSPKYCHWYVVVVNFAMREYQVLDSSVGLIVDHDVELRSFRKGIQACMEAASQADPALPAADMSEWKVRVVEGLPQQADDSSCGLFALKYMELFDGTRLVESFGQEDMEAFRTEVAVQLVFSELNDMSHVKDEVERLMA